METKPDLLQSIRVEEVKKRLKKAYQIFGYLSFFSYVYTVMREIKIMLILILIATGNECRMRATSIQLDSTPKIEMINKPL